MLLVLVWGLQVEMLPRQSHGFFHSAECAVDGTKDHGDGARGIIWRNQGETESRRNSR